MKKNILRILFALIVMVVAVSMLVACGGTPPTEPTGITLNKTAVTVGEGGSVTLTVTVAPDGADSTVTWSSDDNSVATVSGGVVSGVSEGTAIITATTANGKCASCTVTVTVNIPGVISVSGVTVNPSSKVLDEEGDSFTLSASVYPSNATDKTLTWQSTDEDVATVTTVNGVTTVTAVGLGTAKIRAVAHNDVYGECTVTVGQPAIDPSDVIPVGGVIVVPSTRIIDEVGESFTINASIYPNNATYRTLSWESTDEDVATVTVADSGVVTVTTVGFGSAEIRAIAHNDVYGVCNVTVKSPVTVEFIYQGQKVGETFTYAEDGGAITIPTQTAPTVNDLTYLAVPDISTVPTSMVYVEGWYFDEEFTVPYVDGMDVTQDGEETVLLYGKIGDAYEYDIITASAGNYIKITGFLPKTAKSVSIPAAISGHPVTAIGEGAFEGSTLTGATVPACVVTISDDAFRDCENLSSVEFAASSLLTHIGDSAFRGCASLSEISIPESVSFIGTLALFGTDTDKDTQLSNLGVTEKQYYSPKFVFEFLGEDVMPIGAYGEIKSNERVVNGQIAHAPAGVCDPVNGVGLEKALRDFVDSGCNLMEANGLINAIQGQDPTVERSYGHYMQLLEEYGGMMLYRDMSLYGILEEEYVGNAGSQYEKYPNLYGPTTNATLNSYINNLYPQFASFAGVLVKDEPGWVDWIDEFEDPYTYYQREGSSASSALSVDENGYNIKITKTKKGRMDDGMRVWRQYMPDKLFFVNLLQTYAPKWALPNGYYGFNDGGQLDGVPDFTGKNAPLEGELDYEYYYRTYIENVKPQVFSYDYYPLAGSGTNLYNTHFEQLSLANYYAGEYYKQYHQTETGVPWWPMIQLLGWNGFRPNIGATLGEVNWQINTALAYGAKGYTYFTYSAVQSSSVGSAIDQYGNKTSTYDIVQTANKYTQAMAKWLLNADVDHVKHVGDNPNRYDVNTKTVVAPEVTPYRMTVPQDTGMNWSLTTTTSAIPHIISYMKYYANNNYYSEGVDGDVREMYFICNNTITSDGPVILNFNKSVSGSYISAGREYKFSGTQVKLALKAGEGIAIMLDK